MFRLYHLFPGGNSPLFVSVAAHLWNGCCFAEIRCSDDGSGGGLVMLLMVLVLSRVSLEPSFNIWGRRWYHFLVLDDMEP